MTDEEYELIRVSPMKKLEKEVKALKEREGEDTQDKLKDNIERLNEQISKLITININLQAKMTELLIKDAEMIEQTTEMVELLKKASEVEGGGAGEKSELKVDMGPVVDELRKISAQNEIISGSLERLMGLQSKEYTRNLLTKALKP